MLVIVGTTPRGGHGSSSARIPFQWSRRARWPKPGRLTLGYWDWSADVHAPRYVRIHPARSLYQSPSHLVVEVDSAFGIHGTQQNIQEFTAPLASARR